MSSAIVILKYLICCCVFLAVLLVSKVKGGYRLFDEKGPVQNAGALLVMHITGIIWLGTIPFFISDHCWTKIALGTNVPEPLQVIVIILLFYSAMLFARVQSENTFRKIITDQKLFKVLDHKFIVWYLLVRILFLCTYEIFLRGYLLADSINHFGIYSAIVLNCTLYVLLHVPAGKKEMLASAPFGTLLCLICIWIGAAWPAIILHVTLSLAYELNLLKKIQSPVKMFL